MAPVRRPMSDINGQKLPLRLCWKVKSFYKASRCITGIGSQLQNAHVSKPKAIARARSLCWFDILPLNLKIKIFDYCKCKSLDLLPPNLKLEIMEYCTLSSLGRLAQTSHAMGKFVWLYVEQQHIFAQLQGGAVSEVSFIAFGNFYKRLTCTWTAQRRMEGCRDLFSMFGPDDIVHSGDTAYCWGQLFHTVMSGWHDCERDRVYDFMVQFGGVRKRLEIFLSSPVGTHLEEERELRAFYRNFFFKQKDVVSVPDECANWMHRILRQYPDFNQQARLLYLVLGPGSTGGVNWNTWMSLASPISRDDARRWFVGLAFAFDQMLRAPRLFKEHSVLQLLTELTQGVGIEWCCKNVALLFLHAESSTLASKWALVQLQRGDVAKASTIWRVVNVLHSMIVSVYEYDGLKSLAVVQSNFSHLLSNIRDRVCKAVLLKRFVECHRQTVLEMREQSDPVMEYAVRAFLDWLKLFFIEMTASGRMK